MTYTYCHTLSLHDALPISPARAGGPFPVGPFRRCRRATAAGLALSRQPGKERQWRGGRHRLLFPRLSGGDDQPGGQRSEEHTSELQSLMRISYAVFCLKKKKKTPNHND